MSEWISVDDRLPHIAEPVIVHPGNWVFGSCRRVMYNDTDWGFDYFINNVPVTAVTNAPVTHWMPLPEPPESS